MTLHYLEFWEISIIFVNVYDTGNSSINVIEKMRQNFLSIENYPIVNIEHDVCGKINNVIWIHLIPTYLSVLIICVWIIMSHQFSFHSGWLDWMNFRYSYRYILGNCLLWAAFWKLQKVAQIWWLLFSTKN
jgi:hypothetical protein